MKWVLVFLLISLTVLTAQDNHPKREVRAAWVTSVYNLDWPSSRYASSQTQKNELITILDNLQNVGINTIILQIRSECDAMYDSPYEPWSYRLTGQQGTAPSPYYDPLQFACTEAHKRNMELHAWFNPYRAEATIGSYALDQSHVKNQHPEWILQYDKLIFLNPGLSEVREYVAKVISDVVKRYDIDGVHFDDYFYPYPKEGFTILDSTTFANYNRGFSDIGNWRRDNVNIFVESVYDSINTIKPWVKFGISPFGIWKNDVPAGIEGTSSYYDLYCDPLAWLDGQYIDYVNPQLYWEIEGPQDYSILMPWWASVSNERHIYTGHALYKMVDWHNWPVTYITDQISLNWNEPNVQGSVFYRTDHIRYNEKGIADALKNDFYVYPALIPTMEWKDAVVPYTPELLSISQTDLGVELQWNSPAAASDGDTAKWYVVYRFDDPDLIKIENPQNILAILDANSNEYFDNTTQLDETYTYLVTALDKMKNESAPSNNITFTPTGFDELFANHPKNFILEQNYPNPFNPKTVIGYQLPALSDVNLSIYNMLGQKVATLIAIEQPAGIYTVEWDASNYSSGLYLCRLTVGNDIKTRKMILMR